MEDGGSISSLLFTEQGQGRASEAEGAAGTKDGTKTKEVRWQK